MIPPVEVPHHLQKLHVTAADALVRHIRPYPAPVRPLPAEDIQHAERWRKLEPENGIRPDQPPGKGAEIVALNDPPGILGLSLHPAVKLRLGRDIPGVPPVDLVDVDQGQSAVAAFSLGYTLLTLVVASLAVYVFPVMSRFTMSAWECFRLALLMVFRHLPFTVVLLRMQIASICLVVLIPAPMLFIIPGACCYGQSFLMERLLKKYMAKPQTEEEAEKWYYK